MLTLMWIVLGIAACYLLAGGVLFFRQRRFQYERETARTSPIVAGLPEAEEFVLDASDGERLVVWHVPPRGNKPVIVYLHGSKGALRNCVDRYREFIADGTGLLALSYRGYGGSTGRPTERGLITDACSMFDHAVACYDPGRLIVWGHSLGTGVGVALAAERPVRHIILEGAFASAAEIGQRRYPMFPTRWFMLDPYYSDRRIAAVRASILLVHGDSDRLHPISQPEKLFALATSRKQLVILPGGDHDDLLEHGIMPVARQYLRECAG